jgi:hypothetical protein
VKTITKLEERDIAAILEKLAIDPNPEHEKKVRFLLKLYQTSRDNNIKTSAAKCLLSYLNYGTLPTETISFIQRSLDNSIGYR